MCMANSQTLTNELYDPDTGQELFKPRITLGSIFRSRGPGQGPTSLEWIIAWVELVGSRFGRTSLGAGKSTKDT